MRELENHMKSGNQMKISGENCGKGIVKFLWNALGKINGKSNKRLCIQRRCTTTNVFMAIDPRIWNPFRNFNPL